MGHTTSTGGPYHFYCTVVAECIDDELVCNGVSDCKDGTDEELLSCGEYYTLLQFYHELYLI